MKERRIFASISEATEAAHRIGAATLYIDAFGQKFRVLPNGVTRRIKYNTRPKPEYYKNGNNNKRE